jgi:hypothetical protein
MPKPTPDAAPAPEAEIKPLAKCKLDVKALAEAAKPGAIDAEDVRALANRCESAGLRRQVADVLRNALTESGEVQCASLRLAAAECDRHEDDYPKAR